MADETKLQNNSDISEAIKEFELKSDATQPNSGGGTVSSNNSKKETSGISFETDSYAGFKYYKQSDTPKIITLVKSYSGGIIKDDKYAEYVLLLLVGLIVLVSLFLVFRDNIRIPPPQPSPEELIRMEQLNYEMSQPRGN